MGNENSKLMKNIIVVVFLLLFLTITAIVIVPSIVKDLSSKEILSNQEGAIEQAAMRYYEDNPDDLPENLGDTVELSLSELVDYAYVDDIYDSEGNLCYPNTSTVTIKKVDEFKYNYYVDLFCAEYASLETWSNWSDWSSEEPPTGEDIQSENLLFYKFKKGDVKYDGWSSWEDVKDPENYEKDGYESELRTVYRYRDAQWKWYYKSDGKATTSKEYADGYHTSAPSGYPSRDDKAYIVETKYTKTADGKEYADGYYESAPSGYPIKDKSQSIQDYKYVSIPGSGTKTYLTGGMNGYYGVFSWYTGTGFSKDSRYAPPSNAIKDESQSRTAAMCQGVTYAYRESEITYYKTFTETTYKNDIRTLEGFYISDYDLKTFWCAQPLKGTGYTIESASYTKLYKKGAYVYFSISCKGSKTTAITPNNTNFYQPWKRDYYTATKNNYKIKYTYHHSEVKGNSIYDYACPIRTSGTTIAYKQLATDTFYKYYTQSGSQRKKVAVTKYKFYKEVTGQTEEKWSSTALDSSWTKTTETRKAYKYYKTNTVEPGTIIYSSKYYSTQPYGYTNKATDSMKYTDYSSWNTKKPATASYRTIEDKLQVKYRKVTINMDDEFSEDYYTQTQLEKKTGLTLEQLEESETYELQKVYLNRYRTRRTEGVFVQPGEEGLKSWLDTLIRCFITVILILYLVIGPHYGEKWLLAIFNLVTSALAISEYQLYIWGIANTLEILVIVFNIIILVLMIYGNSQYTESNDDDDY